MGMDWGTIKRDHWSNLRAMQSALLQRFVNDHLYPFSPHYRALFDEHKIDPRSIRSIDDLKRVPLTAKQDLLPTPEKPKKAIDFVLQPKPDLSNVPGGRKLSLMLTALSNGPFALRSMAHGKSVVREGMIAEYKPIFFTSTTGRSAERVLFTYSAHDIDNLCESGVRIFDTIGAGNDERVVNAFPYSPHLAFWQTHYGALQARVFGVSTGGGKTAGTRGNLDILEKLDADILIGVPSYVYHLLRTGVAEGRKIPKLRRIVLGAEKVPLGLKQKIIEMLHALGAEDPIHIVGTYGFTEAKCAWAECATAPDVSSGYHLFPDREIFEVVDPESGEPVGEGETGEIVYTPLAARGSVVFRYRTGDLVEGGITYTTPCPHCGATVPRLSSRIGRSSAVTEVKFEKIKGTLVNLDAVAHVLGGDPTIEEWAIVIQKKDDDAFAPDELILHVAPRAGHDPCDELRRHLSDTVQAHGEVSPNKVELTDVATIAEMIGLETALKENRVIDRRPKD